MAIGFPQIRDAFAITIAQNGIVGDFELRTGETFSIDVAESWRSEDPLTAGMDQAKHRCRFMSHLWHENVARAPEKGDQVVLNGTRRYSILDAHAVAWEKQTIAYVARLSG